jgi:hypothetical protein
MQSTLSKDALSVEVGSAHVPRHRPLGPRFSLLSGRATQQNSYYLVSNAQRTPIVPTLQEEEGTIVTIVACVCFCCFVSLSEKVNETECVWVFFLGRKRGTFLSLSTMLCDVIGAIKGVESLWCGVRDSFGYEKNGPKERRRVAHATTASEAYLRQWRLHCLRCETSHSPSQHIGTSVHTLHPHSPSHTHRFFRSHVTSHTLRFVHAPHRIPAHT